MKTLASVGVVAMLALTGCAPGNDRSKQADETIEAPINEVLDNPASEDNSDLSGNDTDDTGSEESSNSSETAGPSDNTDSGEAESVNEDNNEAEEASTGEGNSSVEEGGNVEEGTSEEITAPADGLCTGGAEIARLALALINEARAESRVCGDRAFSATTPVTWSNSLAQVGYTHSKDMSGNNFFDHTGSDGLSAGDRLTNSGYVWRAYGENIAAGYRTVSATVEGWLNSPGHCANIMNPNVAEMGVACAYNSDSTYRFYWTQMFATPR